jgi:uncharacterized protein
MRRSTMLYRKLGKGGPDVSVLGFGSMRLPIVGGNTGPADGFNPNKVIDEDETKKMVDYAIEHGINYFDTAYPYHAGKSELVMGKLLKPYREKINLVTKLPPRFVQTEADCDRILDEQLKKLDTSYLDVYLLHGIGRPSWAQLKALNITKFLDRIQKDGRARRVGFSFHDDVKIFKEIIDSYDWAVCQIQYNYYDEHNQAGKEGLSYAAGKGIGVVVMEPIRGSRLAANVPKEVQGVWDTAKIKRTPAEWALRWVWNHSEVSVALSGMSAMSQMVENVKVANEGKANSLTEDELALIGKVRETYGAKFKVNCTGCAYCMPCETGVNIPFLFSAYNEFFAMENKEFPLMQYNFMLPPEQRASNCAECGECEEKCPQHIPIREELKKVHETLCRPDMRPPGH